MSWVGIVIAFALVDNVVLSRLLGICPCVGAPRNMRTAAVIGIATAVLMSVSGLAAWALEGLVIQPLGLQFLRTPAFVMVVALLAWFIQTAAGAISPSLLRATGFSLPGVAVNCATLGAALIISKGGLSAVESLVAGLSAGAGFLVVLLLLSAIGERLDCERLPKALRGMPLMLISAGLIALAFMAFDNALLSHLIPLQ